MAALDCWRKYAACLSGEHDPSLGITTEVFQEYKIATPHGEECARSMLTVLELALLYGVARHEYKGHGEIIDAGPLLGVGTYAMARGLSHNDQVRRKDKRIYSFDLWLAAGMGSFVEGYGERTGSVLERFLEINRDYLGKICLSPGDLLWMKWDGTPVEVLFIDAAKSLDLNAWVLRNWFPCLIPGESIVIQQDYVHFFEWWIAVTMEFFRDHFELMEFVFGASAVYRCTRKIDPKSIEEFLGLSIVDYKSLMREAVSRAPASVAEVLKCALAALLMDTDREGAARALDSVRCNVGHSDPVQNFSEIAGGNLHLMRELLASRGQGA